MKTFVSLLAFYLLFFVNLAAQDLSNGLILHYPLDASALDISGFGRHGQLTLPVPIEDRFGNPIGAVFLGPGNNLRWPSAPELKPSFPMTISCWIYCNEFPLNGRGIMTNDFVENRYYGVFLSFSYDREVGINIGNGGTPNPDGRRTKVGKTKLKPFQWYHIAAVIHSATDMDLYINGCKEDGYYTGNGNTLAYSSQGRGYLGLGDSDVSSFPPLLYHPGAMDDFRFWNRALSELEIAMLYSNFHGSIASLGADTAICAGETLQLDVTHDAAYSYVWQDGSTLPTYTVGTAGTYHVSVEIADGCFVSDTIVVQNQPVINPIAEEEIPLCNGESVFIDASSSGGISYVWSDGFIGAVRQISTPGNYSLVVGFDNGCIEEDELVVFQLGGQDVLINGLQDTTPCIGQVIELMAPSYLQNPQWNNAATSQTIEVTSSGVYWVEGTYQDCSVSSDTIRINFVECPVCKFYVPNGFSPNSDDINDGFGVYFDPSICTFSFFNLKVFNRWGGLVYESSDPFARWEGYFGGRPAPVGIYAYLLEYSLLGEESHTILSGDTAIVK